MTWTSLQSGLQDIVYGLVPHGVNEVTLIARNGQSTTASVRSNVFGARLDGPLGSGRFSGPAGTVDFGIR